MRTVADGVINGFDRALSLNARIEQSRRNKKLEQRQDSMFGMRMADRERRIGREDVVWKRGDEQYANSKVDRKRRLGRQDIEWKRGDDEYDYRVDRRGVTDKRQDTQYQQGQEDREYGLGRREIIDKRGDTQYEQQQEAYQYGLGRRPIEEKQKDQMHNLNFASRVAGLNRIKNQEVRARAQAKRQEQSHLREEVQRMTGQAMQMHKSGDVEGAYKLFEKANEMSGYEYSGMARGEKTQFANIVRQIGSGKLSIKDPQAIEAARNWARPMMKQSGRYKDFTFDGLKKLKDGRFGVMMKNRKTGKVAPATMGQSSHKEDPLVAFSVDDIVNVSSTGMALENDFKTQVPDDVMQRLAALHVGAGGKLASAKAKTEKWSKLNDTQLFEQSTGNVKNANGGTESGGMPSVVEFSQMSSVQQKSVALNALPESFKTDKDKFYAVEEEIKEAESPQEIDEIVQKTKRVDTADKITQQIVSGEITGNDAVSAEFKSMSDKLKQAGVDGDTIHRTVSDVVENVSIADPSAFVKRLNQKVTKILNDKAKKQKHIKQNLEQQQRRHGLGQSIRQG